MRTPTSGRLFSNSRKGGVVWHTQGAGESIEMTCLGGMLMGNPTILMVTDRNDLDNQLFGVFAGASELLREAPVQANTRTKLRELLSNRPSGGIIFTTIQKFMPGEDEDLFPVLSDRANIVVRSVRETVRASLRVMVRTLLRRYKYPPDKQEAAVDTVLRQAETFSEEWTASM